MMYPTISVQNNEPNSEQGQGEMFHANGEPKQSRKQSAAVK